MSALSTTPGSGWAVQQLAEFLATVTAYPDVASATRIALERAAEALEAEVGAITSGESVRAAIGFPIGEVPDADLLAAARGERTTIEVPGAGVCHVLNIPLGDVSPGNIILGRSGTEGFSPEEAGLIQAMGGVLVLTLRMQRMFENERALRDRSIAQAEERAILLETLRERQVLLERLSVIQRLISRRVPLPHVFDAIVASTSELLGDDPVTLRLTEAGIEGADATWGAADDPARGETTLEAPVFENGVQVGNLRARPSDPLRQYSDGEREVLFAFAEHATIALTDARTVEAKLRQAFYDSLTDLPNRALFLNEMERLLTRAHTRNRGIAVLFCDLDRFKVVNDSLGHEAGDRLLIEVAARVRACLRGGDIAARLGGDEFAILVEGAARAEDVIPTAIRLIQALREPYEIDEKQVSISASVGIAVGSAEAGASDLLRNADVAMFKAKTRGAGHYAIFEPGMHAAAMERLEREADLQRAVDHGDFVMVYQPIVALDGGRIRGFEALVRWQHPTRGLLLPAEFIPLAEENGVILPLGKMILRQSCTDANAWPTPEDGVPLSVSVNLSARQFAQPSLVDDVAAVLAATRLDPARLTLEITETVMMQDMESTVGKLWRIRKLGARVAIDDFGTGYSSLSYLRSFPVDIIKIDKSFVDGVAGTPEESALARAIVKLGRTLNLVTVAEGIEYGEQLRRLRALRCDMGQGYYFSRPLDTAGVAALLARGNHVPADARIMKLSRTAR